MYFVNLFVVLFKCVNSRNYESSVLYVIFMLIFPAFLKEDQDIFFIFLEDDLNSGSWVELVGTKYKSAWYFALLMLCLDLHIAYLYMLPC